MRSGDERSLSCKPPVHRAFYPHTSSNVRAERQVGFESNRDFLPLHEHAVLDHDGFNHLCENGMLLAAVVHTIPEIERLLQGLPRPSPSTATAVPSPVATGAAASSEGGGVESLPV